MLVLTRKSGQKLIIGEDIVITIVSVKASQVKIGIEAPDNVKVFREELLQKIKEENIEARNVDKISISSLAQHLLGGGNEQK